MSSIPTPSVQEGPKLVGSGVQGSNAQQGNAVAVSADGSTAVVGGSVDDRNTGSLWVFTRSGGRWAQQGSKLQGSHSSYAGLGSSVAISADGNTIVAGGPDDNNGVGAAWIFTRTGSVWSQQAKLVGNDYTPNDYPAQGSAVAISADGNTATVGGNGDNFGTGATWVYTRSAGAWTQFRNKLIGTGYSGKAGQGYSLALSADGKTMIVGSGLEGSNNPPVWVFVRNVGAWAQQGSYLTASNAIITQPAQNTSVAVSADGNTFVLGENCDNGLTGAAWIFARTNGTWAQQSGKLLASDAANPAEQGASVSISAKGNVALVGGNTDNNNTGAFWVYVNENGWTQKGSKLVGTGASGPANQGNAVALSADGFTAVSGGFNDNNDIGATWVFVAAVPV